MKYLWFIIQKHIRNTDSYSDTDSGKLDITLSNQLTSLIVTKVSQSITNDQFIDKKNKSPEIRHFVDDSRRFSENMPTSAKISP